MQTNHRTGAPQGFSIIRNALWTGLCLAAISGFATEVTMGAEANDVLEVKGRVVDPEGKPVSAAEVSFFHSDDQVGASGESAADGAFSIHFSKSSLTGDRPDLWRLVSVLAKAPGYAPAWAQVGQFEPGADVELRMVQDDVPIQGRILTLDGRPIAGARIEVTRASSPLDGNLDGFLRAFRDRPVQSTWGRYSFENMASVQPNAFDFQTLMETDEEGRFELRGIGRERLVRCEVRGPDIESSAVLVATRPEVPPTRPLPQEAIDALQTPMPLYPAEFNHFAGPSRPIVGTVKEKDGGQPIAGARVRVYHSDVFHTAWTDADGRYSLEGLPVEGKFYIHVTPSADQPYLPASDSVVASGTRTEVRADFELVRGVLVKGRLVNAVTREPAAGSIEYLVFPDNDYYRQLASGFKGGFPTKTNDDGRFEVVVLPGPGALAAIGSPHEVYRFAEEDEFGQPANERGDITTANKGQFPARLYNRLLPIDPPEGSDPIEVELALRPAPEVRLKLVDEDDRPIVSGVLSGSLSGVVMAPVRGDTFHVPGMDPDETRTVIFYHRERDLAAGLLVSGAEPGTQAVTLRPAATLTGRLVDSEKRPVTDAQVFVWVDPLLLLSHTVVRTDVDGRFHVTGVVPGVPCRLLYRPKPGDTFRLALLTLRSGEVRDLGDIDISQAPAE